MRLLVASLALCAACNDYTIQSNVEPLGEPNPPVVENPRTTDRIVQVTEPLVDVLFVVDNSGSMAQEQDELAANFPKFMDYFLGSGLKYHIGVISTDMDAPKESGKLVEVNGYRWIDENTPQPSDVFSTMTHLGTNGSGDERGRDAAYTAQEVLKDDYNKGFWRDAATVNIITVSDEQDHSNDGTGAATIVGLDEYINYLNDLRADPETVSYSTIVNQEGCCSGAIDEAAGTHYIEIQEAVGGINWDIKDKDWSDVLELLGIQAAGLKREYFLSELPVPDTLDVYVIDTDGTQIEFKQDKDYTYNVARNSITFLEYLPPALSEVYIDYVRLSSADEAATTTTTAP